MKFTIQLSTDTLSVEAGSAMPLGITVTSTGSETDHLELMLDGVDPDWTAITVPTFTLDPGETKTEKILIKPPRESESLAGSYPFVVRVRSLNTGETREEQAFLEVRVFHSVSVDVQPKKGFVTPLKKIHPFEVTVMNLGNVEHQFQLFASDVDDMCAFEFDPERIAIGPGQTKSVQMFARSTRRPLLANPRLHALSVSARSVSHPQIVAGSQAQLEQRALASPGFMAIFALFAILIWGWIAAIPKAPIIEQLILDKKEAYVNEGVQISWRTANAKMISIKADGKLLIESLAAVGSYNYIPTSATTVEITASASADTRTSQPVRQILSVLEKPVPPKAPEPAVLSMKASTSPAYVNTMFELRYKLNSAVTRATLYPNGTPLDLKDEKIQVVPLTEGTIQYKIIVENQEGVRAERVLDVKVVRISQAKIVTFAAEPANVSPTDGRCKLTWQIINATRAELSDGTTSQIINPEGGTVEQVISKTKTFTLIAFDAQGVRIRKSVTIKVRAESTPREESTSEKIEQPEKATTSP